MGEQHSLRVSGELEQVRVACDFVAEVASALGMDDQGIYQCQLSVEEICTNIVEHGYHYQGVDKYIDIACEQKGEMMVISIWDDAPLFNPLELEDPDPNMSLWEREGGGWGVFFVKKYMSTVRYELDHNRNRLILERKINA